MIVLASTYPRWINDYEPSFVHELARRLTHRFDVVAVVPHSPGSARQEILDGVRVSRYRYAPVGMETLVNDGGIAANLRRSPWKWLLLPTFIFMQWFEARRFTGTTSVIHAHWLIPQGLVARALRRACLLTCHGADVFSLRGKLSSMGKRMALSGARRVTVVSSAMVDPVVRLGPGVAPAVRPMGVDLERLFTPADVTRDVAHLLFVGRLVEKKGLDILLRAMPSVVARHPQVRLTIVGHGPLEGLYRASVERANLSHHVHFAGPLPQNRLASLYRSATVFVGPFRPTASGDQEGLGLVMVEALGCGCPVVASDLPATRDVLLGTPGCKMVAHGNIDELAHALNGVLDNPVVAQQAARTAVPLMRERFDWSSVAKGYEDMLIDIMSSASS